MIILAWDADALSLEDYADLAATIGDIARSCGGAGVERIGPRMYTLHG